MSLIGTVLGRDNHPVEMSNEIIANDMIVGAKSATSAYLVACLEASTPELKSIYMNNLNQVLQGHQIMTEVALKKGWYKPYQPAEEQLRETFHYSQNFTQQQA